MIVQLCILATLLGIMWFLRKILICLEMMRETGEKIKKNLRMR